MNVENNYGYISNLFVRLIGYLNLILQFDSYKDDYNEFNKILDNINKWAVKYEKTRNLNFIDNKDLVTIYKKSDELQTKYNCNNKIGSESEFSDYVLNLIWDLRVVYKKMLDEMKIISKLSN